MQQQSVSFLLDLYMILCPHSAVTTRIRFNHSVNSKVGRSV